MEGGVAILPSTDAALYASVQDRWTATQLFPFKTGRPLEWPELWPGERDKATIGVEPTPSPVSPLDELCVLAPRAGLEQGCLEILPVNRQNSPTAACLSSVPLILSRGAPEMLAPPRTSPEGKRLLLPLPQPPPRVHSCLGPFPGFPAG